MRALLLRVLLLELLLGLLLDVYWASPLVAGMIRVRLRGIIGIIGIITIVTLGHRHGIIMVVIDIVEDINASD